MVSNTPVKKIAVGQVSAALWENEINVNGQVKTVLKASVQRRYKDKDGQWKSSGRVGGATCCRECAVRIGGAFSGV